MSRSSIGQYTDELLQARLLEEGPEGESTGGRRSRLLRLNSRWGHVVGVAVGATFLNVGLFDFYSEELESTACEIDIAAGPRVILAQIAEIAECLCRTHRTNNLAGIGIGVPGPVNVQKGWVESPPTMPGWNRYPIAACLQDRLGCEAYVDNDVNLMALGEQAMGIGRTAEDFVFVGVGTGIGAGIMAGGVLHRGHNGCAGEIGHIPIWGEKAPCLCGRVGCLEAVASGAAIAKAAEKRGRQDNGTILGHLLQQQGQLTAEDVGRLAAGGDEDACAIVQEAGRHLGQALTSVVTSLNPLAVVLGGEVLLHMGDLYLAAVREHIYKGALPLATRDLSIVRSSMIPKVGMVGACTLVIDQLLDVHRGGRLSVHGQS